MVPTSNTLTLPFARSHLRVTIWVLMSSTTNRQKSACPSPSRSGNCRAASAPGNVASAWEVPVAQVGAGASPDPKGTNWAFPSEVPPTMLPLVSRATKVTRPVQVVASGVVAPPPLPPVSDIFPGIGSPSPVSPHPVANPRPTTKSIPTDFIFDNPNMVHVLSKKGLKETTG